MRVEIWVKFCHQQRFFFFFLFLNPCYFSYLGCCYNTVLLWSTRNVLWTTNWLSIRLSCRLNFYFSVNLSSNRETNTVLLKTKIFYHNSECNHRIVQILYDSRSNTPYRNSYLADLCQCNCVIWFHICSISSLFFVTQ